MPPPAATSANQNPEPACRPQRSPRLNPELDRVCTLQNPPRNLAPQSRNSLRVARTHPLVVSYNQCLGAKEDPLSFTSLYLEDLKIERTEYLSTMQQLVDALPKTEDPTSRFALRSHIARPSQLRLQHSMRAVLWWLLPSDGEFRRASHSLQYYLARQGRRVVLRGVDVTQPRIYENRLNWVPDPAPPAPRRLDDLTSSVPASTSSVPACTVNTPPSEAHPRLLRRLRPSRRMKRQPAATANENSSRLASSTATRPRSTANKNSLIPGNQPGISQPMRSTPVEHPQTFLRPQRSQFPNLRTDENAER